jgi:hypothetical protein
MNKNSFNKKYLNSLKKKIPVLDDEELFDNVMLYFIQPNKSNIETIKNRLKIVTSISYIDPFNENVEINENSIKNKIIKSHKLSGKALIESILNCTLNYYNNEIIMNTYVNFHNSRLRQIMNIAPGIKFSKFIINLYNNNDINNINKNRILLDILKEIAIELNDLQELCGFIHGDLHTGNIFIDKDKDENYKITFIDFDYSYVRIPLNNINNNKRMNISINENLNINQNQKIPILIGATVVNLENKNIMNIEENESLKAIDLFHLIGHLSIEDEEQGNNFKNKKNYNIYQTLIKKIANQSFNNFNQKKINTYEKFHKFERSNDFKNINTFNLIPENFINIINDI